MIIATSGLIPFVNICAGGRNAIATNDAYEKESNAVALSKCEYTGRKEAIADIKKHAIATTSFALNNPLRVYIAPIPSIPGISPGMPFSSIKALIAVKITATFAMA